MLPDLFVKVCVLDAVVVPVFVVKPLPLVNWLLFVITVVVLGTFNAVLISAAVNACIAVDDANLANSLVLIVPEVVTVPVFVVKPLPLVNCVLFVIVLLIVRVPPLEVEVSSVCIPAPWAKVTVSPFVTVLVSVPLPSLSVQEDILPTAVLSTFVHVVLANTAQSPTCQSVIPFKFVLPATDTI